MAKARRWERGRYAQVVRLIHRELKDGYANEAIRYRDFDCSPHGFMSQLYAMARDHGMGVSCASSSTRVVYRFYNPKGPWKPNLRAFPVFKRMKDEDGSY